MDKANIIRQVKQGISSQFEIYSWENMIDDLELTEEEKAWAKKNTSYIAYIIEEEPKQKEEGKKMFMAFEYAEGYTELPSIEGESINSSNSQLLLEGEAESKEDFIKNLKADLLARDIDINKLSVEIKEVKIINQFYL